MNDSRSVSVRIMNVGRDSDLHDTVTIQISQCCNGLTKIVFVSCWQRSITRVGDGGEVFHRSVGF